MPFEVPARFADAVPDPAQVSVVRRKLVDTATPVRPMPSNAAMTLIWVLVFAALAIVLALPFGLHGLAKVSLRGGMVEYSVELLLAFVLGGAVVEQMIPGSRRILPVAPGVLLATLLLSVTAAILFPDFETRNFVRQGMPCLRLGLLCALPAAGLTWAGMRRGLVTHPVSASVFACAFAGLLGVGVLALHCPIFSAPHIVVWHVGTIVVTSFLGVMVGGIVARFR